jgi:FkbH-like protein
MSDIGEWDSLGQMGIAAAIHSRFGIVVAAADTFCLCSVADIVRFVETNCGKDNLTDSTKESLPCDPELLPLCDHDFVTQELAHRTGSLPLATGDELRVVIAATFTADALASSLKLWAQAFRLNITVEFAGYNQIAQELLSPGSLFRSNRTGLNIVLTRPEDLLADDRANSADALLDAIAAFSREANGTLVVATLPPAVSKLMPLDRQKVGELRDQWRQTLSEMPDVIQLDFAGVVEEIGIAAACQTDHEVVARSPYSAVVYRELGISIARLARQRRVAPAKVVAVDADGVLWGGVIAEEGLQGIHLGTDHPGRSFRLFQQYLKSLKARGQLLVLVSRNDPEDVWKVFDQHPEMVLRRDDFAAARINWLPKSENVKEIAKELNLGLDSFVFIDDDAANRLEMAAHAPGVTVVPLPTDAAQYVPVISRLWRFDAAQVTAEDQNRTEMIQQEQERKRLHETAGDFQSYLRSLSLRVSMRSANELDMPRVAQLTQKTNQFNLSLKRRSTSDLAAMGDRFSILVIEASDRFGDYGLVGVCILERPSLQGGPFQLDTLLMSCRVLGRGVEEAALHGLANLVKAGGGDKIVAPLVAGPRNQPIVDFLNRNGFRSADESKYTVDVAFGLPLPGHIDWQETFTSAASPVRYEECAAA